MKKLIMIKYGELTTKKDNLNFFLKTLQKNVDSALEGITHKTTYDSCRMFVETTDYEKALASLQTVFGIYEITPVYEISNEMEVIESSLIDLIDKEEFTTFKVEVKRSNKHYPGTSTEIAAHLGGIVLKNKKNVTVDVHNPEKIIYVEIRNSYAYLYMENIPGLGGYPVGVQGKGMLMLSGGIDSPVAGFLSIKRGIKLECVYFEAPPHTSKEAKNKVLELAKKLAVYNNGSIKVHCIPFTEIEEAIYKEIPNDYLITIMRRMMYRISSILAYRVNAKALVNGESIGQVASQTLTSMSCINEAIKMPVIRPVACFDKLEIISLARKIDTYETSILPYEDCCTIFVPKHPVINPQLDKCYEYEELIPYKDMIHKAIKEHEVITITAKEEKQFEELL